MNINLKGLSVISFLIIPVYFSAIVRSQELPSSKTMEALAAISNYEPGNKEQSDKWPYSEYFKGLYAYYKISSDTAGLNKVLRWGSSVNWDIPGGKSSKIVSDLNCGQVYIDMYLLDRYKEERIRNIRAYADKFIQEKSGVDNPSELSIVLPVFAGLGTIYNNDKYFQKMDALFLDLRDTLELYDKEQNLWSSKEKDSPNRFSSEVNGQFLAGLVKTLASVTQGRYRKDYENMLKEMTETIVPLQRNDGLWNDNLKDTLETNEENMLATAMIIYGVAGGINSGILNRKDYQPVVTRSWETLLPKLVRPDGTLALPSMAEERLAWLAGSLLMAGSEMYTLQKSVEPKQKVKKDKEGDKKEEKPAKETRSDKKKK